MESVVPWKVGLGGITVSSQHLPSTPHGSSDDSDFAAFKQVGDETLVNIFGVFILSQHQILYRWN